MKIGFVGWRGIVGSVLRQRMHEEGDFEGLQIEYFSTSNVGADPPDGGDRPLQDAYDVFALASCDVIVSCQGGSYTKAIYPSLRGSGWDGYWLDASSELRLDETATLILDPVNREQIESQLAAGCRTFVGANCTVSLLLMAIGGLFRAGLVEWVSAMTYQAISGAGANHLMELARQVQSLGVAVSEAGDSNGSVLDLASRLSLCQRSASLPTKEIGVPLVCNVLPWIDCAMEDGGQTREEWKASVEATKILGASQPVVIDGICARIDALRCHSQAVLIKLTREADLDELEIAIVGGNPWVRFIENSKDATMQHLSPAAVSGTLDIAVGRLRRLSMGTRYVSVFTVGDQLLWGAAEPLRRMLSILRANENWSKRSVHK